jgi:hypothetical protein
MSTQLPTLPIPLVDSETDAATATSVTLSALSRLDEVSRLIDSISAEWGESIMVHRRSDHRAAFTASVVLTPFDAGLATPNGEPKLVTGRNVSLQGISFVHELPLPFRDVVLTFALPDGGVEAILTRLKWCRFTRDGQYHSGGRLLHSVTSPIGRDIDWNLLRRA